MKLLKSWKSFFKRLSKKPTVYQIYLILILVFLLPVFQFTISSFKPPAAAQARVVMAFKSSIRTFEGEIAEDMTALEAVTAATRAGNMAFKYGFDKNGRVKILQLGPYQSSGNRVLVMTLNNQPLKIPEISSVLVKNGDVINISTNAKTK